MTTMNVYPAAAFSAMPAPMFDTWSGVTGLYRKAMEASVQQMVLSSTAIVQEHTLRAFMSASQACAEALARNAMAVQQQSMTRFADANQQAMGMMGGAWMKAWTGNTAA
jgi:hypothetical protein